MDVDQIGDNNTIDGVFYVIELALRAPSGKRIVLRTNRTVSCATLEDVRTTMRDIISTLDVQLQRACEQRCDSSWTTILGVQSWEPGVDPRQDIRDPRQSRIVRRALTACHVVLLGLATGTQWLLSYESGQYLRLPNSVVQ